jgi:hypothetical protein
MRLSCRRFNRTHLRTSFLEQMARSGIQLPEVMGEDREHERPQLCRTAHHNVPHSLVAIPSLSSSDHRRVRPAIIAVVRSERGRRFRVKEGQSPVCLQSGARRLQCARSLHIAVVLRRCELDELSQRCNIGSNASARFIDGFC